jgi:hypothetical protein
MNTPLESSTRRALSLLGLCSGLLACDQPKVDIGADTVTQPSPPPPPASSVELVPVTPQATPADTAIATAPSAGRQAAAHVEQQATERTDARIGTPIFSRNVARLRSAAEAFADRSLYLHWAPDPQDHGNHHVCHDPDHDGTSLNAAAWGLGRADVVDVSFDDATNARASAQVEVVRVLSVEGDPETSERGYTRLDMMVVEPVLDTMDVIFRRRDDGEWVQCAVFNGSSLLEPISLTGPPADTLLPRGLKLTRAVPPGATWKRVRELADSVGRG